MSRGQEPSAEDLVAALRAGGRYAQADALDRAIRQLAMAILQAEELAQLYGVPLEDMRDAPSTLEALTGEPWERATPADVAAADDAMARLLQASVVARSAVARLRDLTQQAVATLGAGGAP
jgi:hypothetical protein